MLLRPNVYTYEFEYRFGAKVASFEDFDELYWNVTGNNWAFPIERVTATVILPGGARMNRGTSYTGPAGSKDRDATLSVDGAGNPEFMTTRSPAAGEGLTIALSWPKGFVAEPTPQDKLLPMLLQHPASLAALATVVIVFAYYMLVWTRVGRDPAKGTIVPVSDPMLSPAAMRYIEHMGYDDRCTAAALLNLAVKGLLSIRQDESTIHVERRDGDRGGVSPEEAVLLQAFENNRSFSNKSDRDAIRTAVDELKTHLSSRYDRKYFRLNGLYFFAGVAFTVGGLVVAFVSADLENAVGTSVGLFLWSFATWETRIDWRKALSAGVFSAYVGAVFRSLFLVGLWGCSAVYLGCVVGYLAAVSLALAGVLNFLFLHLLRAPTRLGRVALDEIEGTRLYLTVAEEDRLRIHYGGERTLALFERFLPYAVALGVETQWSERFADILERAGRPDADGYQTSWYKGGSDSSPSSIGSFPASLTSALSEATASDGGGSSGGGGGGGGGGGW